MGGFAPETAPPPLPATSEDEDDDAADDATTSENDDDGNASSSGTDEMSTWHSYPLSLVTKGEVLLDMRVVILRGRVSIGPFC